MIDKTFLFSHSLIVKMVFKRLESSLWTEDVPLLMKRLAPPVDPFGNRDLRMHKP